MLPFFRKIRWRLAQNNQFFKYSRYAIGEIVLVVVGILIALQINNWNENKKLKVKEIKVLKSIKFSLNEDISNLDFHVNLFDESKNSINVLIEYMAQDYPYKDSLKYHFGKSTHLWNPTINKDVFENLKSEGLDLISNDSLKKKILRYYSYAEYNLGLSTQRYSQLIEDASKNIFNTRFKTFWNGNYEAYRKSYRMSDLKVEMIPNDYQYLKKDKEYLYFLTSLKNQHFWYRELALSEANYMAKELLKHINVELKK